MAHSTSLWSNMPGRLDVPGPSSRQRDVEFRAVRSRHTAPRKSAVNQKPSHHNCCRYKDFGSEQSEGELAGPVHLLGLLVQHQFSQEASYSASVRNLAWIKHLRVI